MRSSRLRTDYDSATGILVLAGELLGDREVDHLRAAIDEHSMSFVGDLHLDLTEVTYLPSTAVGVLLSSLQAARRTGATLTVGATPGTIAARVLEVVGVPRSSAELPGPAVGNLPEG